MHPAKIVNPARPWDKKSFNFFFLLLQIEPEEVEKRAAFLRGQRDKLLAMKRAEREKQLEAATPQARPKSARAARNALGRGAFRQEIDPRLVVLKNFF